MQLTTSSLNSWPYLVMDFGQPSVIMGGHVRILQSIKMTYLVNFQFDLQVASSRSKNDWDPTILNCIDNLGLYYQIDDKLNYLEADHFHPAPVAPELPAFAPETRAAHHCLD
ncbi:hypothetical protein Tco_1173255 [Tanacetum coccineum]|uniref:Uncharacterized protein n=1 Tax=Tanacetum coccineum TaxID=301880 RepID=A0ABQ5JD15_9ASTR